MILKMLATILWLGNISFKVTDSENHIEVVGDEGKIHSMHMSFDGLYAPPAVYCDLMLLNSETIQNKKYLILYCVGKDFEPVLFHCG
jgi:hypothetical protein